MVALRSTVGRVVRPIFARLVRLVPLTVYSEALSYKRTSSPLEYRGERLPYLFHSYNNLGITERSAEAPIIRHYLTSRLWQRVLEVGNVTNYYEDYFAGLFPNKTVVDKIEHNHNIVTSDISDFTDAEGFDFIFSISTFEHMDSDLGRNQDYVPGSAVHGTVAADNIIHCYEKLLRPGGLMVITAPMGYTPEWDETVKGAALEDYGFHSLQKRMVSRVGEQSWRESEAIDPSASYPYGRPYRYANHISVLEIAKSH